MSPQPALRSVVSDQEGDVSGMIAATDRGAHGLDEKEGGA